MSETVSTPPIVPSGYRVMRMQDERYYPQVQDDQDPTKWWTWTREDNPHQLVSYVTQEEAEKECWQHARGKRRA